MVALPQVYNTADLPDTGGNIVLIPDGKYPAIVVASELKPTKDNTGQFLELKIVITAGEHRDTEFTERLNIVNQNATAVKIAYSTLARISEALGMNSTPPNSELLHNRPLVIETKTEKGEPYKDRDGVEKQGKDKSIIKKYHAPTTVGNPGAGLGQSVPAAAVTTAAPAQAKPW